MDYIKLSHLNRG